MLTALLLLQAFIGGSYVSGSSIPFLSQLALLDGFAYPVSKPPYKPGFLQGDDEFDVAVQVNNADLERLLTARQAQGYNALWIALTDNVYQSNPPQNNAGDVPFDGADFTNFDSAYWAHIDYVIQRCQAHGIIVLANPAFVGLNSSSGWISSIQSASNATMQAYGTFLGARYTSTRNLIWLIGGDADPNVAGLYAKLQYLAIGIAGADTNHLITLEACRSGCSAGSDYSSIAAVTLALGSVPSWLTLNWVYPTYANAYTDCVASIGAALPSIMGEDWYELEHSMTGLQLREEGYWEVLGGCQNGRIAGNGAVWTMGGPSDTSGVSWQSQVLPGSGGPSTGSQQFTYLGRLMRSRKWWKLASDTGNSVLTGGIGSGTTISVASCTTDGQICIVYDPIGASQPPQIAMGHFSGTVHAWWFNPQTAATTDLSTFTNSGTHTFTPSDGNDWVLVLDLNSAGLPAPGTSVE